MKCQLVPLVLILATGCGSVHRGVVAMKISDTTVHVCLNKDEVAVGDTVKVFRNVCPARHSKPALTGCDKRLIGRGTVTEILNTHYSVVSLPEGGDVKEGDFVERTAAW